MAVVHARDRGWSVEQLEFVIVQNLAGAVDAFAAGAADVFFWEKFMTKPLVDAGKFRRVAEFAAPWPAFVACVADAASEEQRTAFARVLTLVLDEARALHARPDAAALIAARHGLLVTDVAEWLTTTRWSDRVRIAPQDVDPACSTLLSLGVLARSVAARDCLLRAPREE
jgi:ABC-type nitrate/sulfonate/bicarbonate transport system substrate-binding protein